MNPHNLSWKQALHEIASTLQGAAPASVDSIAMRYKSPFHVLVSTILSLRTRDAVTLAQSERLFERANSLHSLAALSEQEIATLIYSVGFYATKARRLKQLCAIVIREHKGIVPNTKEALLQLPGVGLKTANLVLSAGFGIPAICVDIHVHRIANRLGFVHTTHPDKTEAALRKTLPKEFWLDINQSLVRFGQRTCKPQRPDCPRCPLQSRCPTGRAA